MFQPFYLPTLTSIVVDDFEPNPLFSPIQSSLAETIVSLSLTGCLILLAALYQIGFFIQCPFVLFVCCLNDVSLCSSSSYELTALPIN